MKSLLGGGALGMLVGSSRGRKLGGKALKYGALAGVGALAWWLLGRSRRVQLTVAVLLLLVAALALWRRRQAGSAS